MSLLQKKQEVGEVTAGEVDMYEAIDPCIRTYYSRTFNTGSFVPKVGLGIGASLFAYASIFNFSVPTRIAYFVVPLVIDILRTSRDTRS